MDTLRHPRGGGVPVPLPLPPTAEAEWAPPTAREGDAGWEGEAHTKQIDDDIEMQLELEYPDSPHTPMSERGGRLGGEGLSSEASVAGTQKSYRNMGFLTGLYTMKLMFVFVLCLVAMSLEARTVHPSNGYRFYFEELEMVFSGKLVEVLATEVYLRATRVKGTNVTQVVSNLPTLEEATARTNEYVQRGSDRLAALGITTAWIDKNIRGDDGSNIDVAAVLAIVREKIMDIRTGVLGRVQELLDSPDVLGYYHYIYYVNEIIGTRTRTNPFHADARDAAEGVEMVVAAVRDLTALTSGHEDTAGDIAALTALLDLQLEELSHRMKGATRSQDVDKRIPHSVLYRFQNLVDSTHTDVLGAMASWDRRRQQTAANWINCAVVAFVTAMFVALEVHRVHSTQAEEASLSENFYECEDTAGLVADYCSQITSCGRQGLAHHTGATTVANSLHDTNLNSHLTRDDASREHGEKPMLIRTYFLRCIESLRLLEPYIPMYVFEPPDHAVPVAGGDRVPKISTPTDTGIARTTPKVEFLMKKHTQNVGADDASETESTHSNMLLQAGSRGNARMSPSGSFAGSSTAGSWHKRSMSDGSGAGGCPLSLTMGMRRGGYVLVMLDIRMFMDLPAFCESATAATDCVARFMSAMAWEAGTGNGAVVEINPMYALLSFTSRTPAALAALRLVSRANDEYFEGDTAVTAAALACNACAGTISTGIHRTYMFAGESIVRLEKMVRLNRAIETKVTANATICATIKKEAKEIIYKPCSIIRHDKRVLMVYELCYKADGGSPPSSAPASRQHTPSTQPLGGCAGAEDVAKADLLREREFHSIVQTTLKDTPRALSMLVEYVKKYEAVGETAVLAPVVPRTQYLWDFLVGMNEQTSAEGDEFMHMSSTTAHKAVGVSVRANRRRSHADKVAMRDEQAEKFGF